MSIAYLKYHTHTHTYAHTGKTTNSIWKQYTNGNCTHDDDWHC